MKRVMVLGCTGSIGSSTLDIIRLMPDTFCVSALVSHKNSKALSALVNEFRSPSSLTERDGIESIPRLIEETKPDIVVNGIAGAAGLLPSKMVLERGIDLALANKETVVMAGNLIQKVAKENGAHILPVDSEHSAIFTLINQCGRDNVESIILTASGGPFRLLKREELFRVSVKDALKHPTWNMGKKITIDSATLANKGLEVIEACALFGFSVDKIQVVIHPQSLVHSLIRLTDGVMYAQVSEPDMKNPILNALMWPDVAKKGIKRFELFDKEMTFSRPRYDDFKMLKYAFDVAKMGGAYPIAYNAANEEAVNAFIGGKIGFMDIERVVSSVLKANWAFCVDSFDEVFEYDRKARLMARSIL